jgi:hypothetical protein
MITQGRLPDGVLDNHVEPFINHLRAAAYAERMLRPGGVCVGRAARLCHDDLPNEARITPLAERAHVDGSSQRISSCCRPELTLCEPAKPGILCTAASSRPCDFRQL